MTDITLSSAVRSNLLSLQSTADLLSSTQTKLATGKKVNSALDDPSAFFTASSLNSRAGDLSRILDSVGGAVQTIKAADEGISSITKLVESAQATARQALQSAKATNANVEGTGASVSADSAVTITGSGLTDANDLLTSIGATDVVASTATSTAITNTADLSANIAGFAEGTLATQSSVAIVAAGNIDAGAATNETFTIDAGGETFSFEVGSDTGGINTVDGLRDAINAASQNGVNLGDLVTADNNGGQLRITGNNSDVDFTLGGAATANGGYLDPGSSGGIAGAVNSVDGTNDTLQLTVDGTTYDFVIGSQGTEAASLSDLVNNINNSDAGNGVTASIDGTNQLVITADDTESSFTIGGDSDVVAGLGLTAGQVDPDTTGTASQFQINIGAAAATFQIGTDSGEVNTLTDLVNSINSNSDISGLVKASNSNGQLKLEALDADSAVSISGSADIAAGFGIAETTYSPTNLITQGTAQAGSDTTLLTKALANGGATTLASLGFTNGDAITVDTGSGSPVTLTVAAANNDGNDEITDINGLITELGNLTNVAASIDGDNRLQIDLTNGETFSISNGAGNTGSLSSAFGLSEATSVGGANQIGDFSTDTTDTSIAFSFSTGSDEENLSIQIGASPSSTIEFGYGAGKVSTVSELNTALGGTIGGTASTDADGNLDIESSTFGDDITLSGTVDLSKFGTSANTYTENVSSTRTALEAEFNSLRDQIDQLAKDASFNGVNLLNGDDLTVTFNEDGSSSLDIEGVTFNSASLGIPQIATDGFQTNDAINASLKSLDTSLTTLRSQASTFGSKLSVVEIRQDFTKGLTNVLETGAADLTLADTNREGANLLSLQTRQQLSTTALSLASQADQNVLRLF